MKYRVRAYRNGEEFSDEVAVEKDLELVVNGSTVAFIKLSPGYEKEFARGFCLGEGFIDGLCDIKEIEVGKGRVEVEVDEMPGERKRYVSSECLSGWRSSTGQEVKVESDLKVRAQSLEKAMKRMQEESRVWKATGGVHSSALVEGEEFTMVEDVSRHASIDKLVGIGLNQGLDFSRSYLLTSGRVPGDMVSKAARAGIPVVASRTAVLYSGIQAAKKTKVSLVGFVRGKRMNIYTHRERIEV